MRRCPRCGRWMAPHDGRDRRRYCCRADSSNGARRRMEAWFRAYPAANMDVRQVALIFGCSLRYARNCLSELVQQGVLQRRTVWSLKGASDARPD